MFIDKEFADKVMTSLSNRNEAISSFRSNNKKRNSNLIEYLRTLSDKKLIEILEDLSEIQSEWVLDECANKSSSIELTMIGRIYIRPNRETVLTMRKEGLKDGKSYAEINTSIGSAIKNYNITKRTQKQPVFLNFNPHDKIQKKK